MANGSGSFVAIAAALGLALAVHLYLSVDIAGVAGAVSAIGWGIGLVVLFRLVPLGCDSVGWWTVFRRGARPPFGKTFLIRWVCESVNALLPVAQVGGEVVRARLLTRAGLAASPAAGASVVVDLTLGIVATTAFSVTGVLLLVNLTAGGATHRAAWALFGLTGVLGLLVTAQRRGWVGRGLVWLMSRLGGRLAGTLEDHSRAFDRALAEAWRKPTRLLRAQGWRLAGSFASAGEIWLCLTLQGADVGFAEAVALESLTFALRTAAFVVPGGLGLQEGSLLVLGQMLGLAPEQALAVALIKRARELALGLPALALWWWLETRGRALEMAAAED